MSDFDSTSRNEGRPCARAWFAAISLGFNLDSRPDTEWRFCSDVRDRVNELCAELQELFETGAIEVNPAHAAWAVARDARNNVALQSLIRKASSRTVIRKSGHE